MKPVYNLADIEWIPASDIHGLRNVELPRSYVSQSIMMIETKDYLFYKGPDNFQFRIEKPKTIASAVVAIPVTCCGCGKANEYGNWSNSPKGWACAECRIIASMG